MSPPVQLELRWQQRANRWVSHRQPFDPKRFDVVELKGDTEARAFVEAHHYAATYPAARWRFGLMEGADLVGACVFSHPCSDKVLTNVFPGRAADSVELGRLVLLDKVGFNGESWFVRRCLDQLKQQGVRGVVSFSDPVQRVRADGVVIMPGHVGTVYQALGARYLGRSTPQTLHILPDTTTFSARAAAKVRQLDRGWRYAVDQLLAAGADPFGPELEADQQGRVDWLKRALVKVTRTTRHPGNHRYAWALQPKVVSFHGPDWPYPKKAVAP